MLASILIAILILVIFGIVIRLVPGLDPYVRRVLEALATIVFLVYLIKIIAASNLVHF